MHFIDFLGKTHENSDTLKPFDILFLRTTVASKFPHGCPTIGGNVNNFFGVGKPSPGPVLVEIANYGYLVFTVPCSPIFAADLFW